MHENLSDSYKIRYNSGFRRERVSNAISAFRNVLRLLRTLHFKFYISPSQTVHGSEDLHLKGEEAYVVVALAL